MINYNTYIDIIWYHLLIIFFIDWTLPRPVAYRTQLSSDWWPVRAVFAELHQKFVDAHPT